MYIFNSYIVTNLYYYGEIKVTKKKVMESKLLRTSRDDPLNVCNTFSKLKILQLCSFHIEVLLYPGSQLTGNMIYNKQFFMCICTCTLIVLTIKKMFA